MCGCARHVRNAYHVLRCVDAASFVEMHALSCMVRKRCSNDDMVRSIPSYGSTMNGPALASNSAVSVLNRG